MSLLNAITSIMDEINKKIGDIPKGPERTAALKVLATERLKNPNLTKIEIQIYKGLMMD